MFPTHTLTIDHAIPKSIGGGFETTNLRAACESCNRQKGDMTAAEFFDVIR